MKKKKTIIILIIILILFFIYLILKIEKINVQDDFIFFKLLGQGQVTEENIANSNNINDMSDIYNINSDINKYIFDVSYKNTKLQNVDLLNTIDQQTLVKEKIAPGTKGSFEIVITSNENLEYQVMFKSKNEKPKNLVFYIEGSNKEFKTLESLQENLKGNIKLNETKSIKINWEWRYENGTNGNNQDTEDGSSITKYNFDIYTVGNL